MAIRSPICVVVGHVDHGKSSVLDFIRGTNIVAKEAGAITQAIGASIIPTSILTTMCGDLLRALKTTITLPGLLFIDTPGHAAFTSMRERGGSLADIAVLVVDINEGIKPQTLEAIQILRKHKTPFVVAANKIDLIAGFKAKSGCGLIASINENTPGVTALLDKKIYELVGSFYEMGFKAERFDRVSSFTSDIAIIPISATKGYGMPELLMVISVLAQRYLEESLTLEVSGPAQGTIVEVKEQQGLGTVLDTIIYEGTLSCGDTIVIAHPVQPIITKVRALLTPSSVDDMRDSKTRFNNIKHVQAASGVRICAPGISDAIAGMPFEAVGTDSVDVIAQRIQESVEDITQNVQHEGVMIKADTLGGIEALMSLLSDAQIPVRKASIGEITKKDLIDAQAQKESDPLHCVILGFNIKRPVESTQCAVFCAPVIYQIIDEYLAWRKAQEEKARADSLDGLPSPCKMEYLRNATFRQSHPAIIGVEIQGGTLLKGALLMKDGQSIGVVKNIQEKKESVAQAQKGQQVAISLDGITAGRQIRENDVLYSYIDEESFRDLKTHKDLLSGDQREVLKDIARIMRQDNPVWGI